MVVKFTSKSNKTLRFFFFFYFGSELLYFTEFPPEIRMKDQDGALILFCLPVLRKICSKVLLVAIHCRPLF